MTIRIAIAIRVALTIRVGLAGDGRRPCGTHSATAGGLLATARGGTGMAKRNMAKVDVGKMNAAIMDAANVNVGKSGCGIS